MNRGTISILDVFNKIHYLQNAMTPNKIIMKELPNEEIGLYSVNKHQMEALIGIVNENDKAVITDTGQIQIGGFFFTGFRVEQVVFEKIELGDIYEDFK